MTAAIINPERHTDAVVDPVTKALAWRYVKLGWGGMLGALGITCLIPTLLIGVIRVVDRIGVVEAIHEVVAPLQRIFFLFHVIGVPTVVLVLMLQLPPLFPKPVTTRRLMHTHFGLGLLTITALHLFTVGYYRLMFGVPVPVIGGLVFAIPTLFVLAGLGALVVDARLWRAILFALLTATLVGVGMWRFDTPAVIGRPGGWLTPTMTEFVVLLLSGVCGYAFACHTAARARRGELQSWRVAEEYLLRFLNRVGRLWMTRPTFRATTPIGAQLRFVFWSRGAAVPLIAALFSVPVIAVAWHDADAALAGWVGTVPVALGLFLFLSGFVVGHTSSAEKAMDMDLYRATRPLSDRQLAYSTISVGLFSTLVAMGIMLILGTFLLGAALITGASPGDVIRHVQFSGINSDGMLLAFFRLLLFGGLIGWMAFGVVLTIMLSGRIWLVLSGMFLGVGGLLVNVLSEGLLGVEFAERLRLVGGCLLAAATATFTVWCFTMAQRKQLIETRHTIFGGCLWLAGVVLILSLAPTGVSTIPPIGYFMVICVMSLTALPVGGTPVAVWWNRHR